ncbi:hypothetical protein JW977_03110 [Candidatus Falkowbacteria bacterium]|nr:hypothetical protein [Candidatus Falkowbacteria bacterium]
MTKLYKFIIELLTKYIIWIIVGLIIIAWWFYPELLETIGQWVLIWGPVIALIFTLILALTRTKIKSKKDEQRGIVQYDITFTKWELYIADLIIYGGALGILIIPLIIDKNRVGVADLIQTLAFFMLATWLKQLFINKIPK